MKPHLLHYAQTINYWRTGSKWSCHSSSSATAQFPFFGGKQHWGTAWCPLHTHFPLPRSASTGQPSARHHHLTFSSIPPRYRKPVAAPIRSAEFGETPIPSAGVEDDAVCRECRLDACTCAPSYTPRISYRSLPGQEQLGTLGAIGVAAHQTGYSLADWTSSLV